MRGSKSVSSTAQIWNPCDTRLLFRPAEAVVRVLSPWQNVWITRETDLGVWITVRFLPHSFVHSWSMAAQTITVEAAHLVEPRTQGNKTERGVV